MHKLLLILALLCTVGAEPTDVSLSFSKNVETYDIENLPQSQNERYTLTIAEEQDAKVLVEFIPRQRKPGETREGEELEQGPADIILAAVQGAEDEPAFTTTGRLKDVNPDLSGNDRNCNDAQPCFKESDSISVDAMGFRILGDRAYVRLDSVDSRNDQVFITVTNHDRKQGTSAGFGSEEKVRLRPKLSGQLRITVSPTTTCPGYVSEEKPECAGNGECSPTGDCECNGKYAGRYCLNRLYDAHDKNDLPEKPQEPEGGWHTTPLDDGITVEVDPFEVAVFKWDQKKSRSNVLIQGVYLKGPAPDRSQSGASSDTVLQAIITKNDPKLPVYPVEGSGAKVCSVYEQQDQYVFVCLLRVLDEGASFRLTFYANARAAKDNPLRSGVVSFFITRCGVRGEPKCPVRPSIPIPAAVLAVCTATVAVTALAVILMLWLDRRHGFTMAVDRLSQKELERMYPTKKFVPSLLDGSGTGECSICIADFEQGEDVRVLHCNHVYHSKCLDPWVTQSNASCPACRADIRIQDLSDKRRLRSVVRFLLAPVVWVRARRARRSGVEASTILTAGNTTRPGDIESGPSPPGDLQDTTPRNTVQDEQGLDPPQRQADTEMRSSQLAE